MWRANLEEFNNRVHLLRLRPKCPDAYKANSTPSQKTWQKNGKPVVAQTLQPIVTKLGTVTQWHIAGALAEPEFPKSSARRRYRSEKISFFALPAKLANLIFLKIGTETQGRNPHKLVLTDFPKVACRGRCCSEIFRFVCENFYISYSKILKKLPKIRGIRTHNLALRSCL
jgi:hypothetical protein